VQLSSLANGFRSVVAMACFAFPYRRALLSASVYMFKACECRHPFEVFSGDDNDDYDVDEEEEEEKEKEVQGSFVSICR
jgi:hypothetical protein